MTILASPSAPSIPATGMWRFARTHPLVAYFLIAFGGTWMVLWPLALSRDGLGVLPFTIPAPLIILGVIGGTALGPTLGGYLITRAVSGHEGVRLWRRRLVQWRVRLPWYGAILVGYPVAVLFIVGLIEGYNPLSAAAKWPLYFTTFLPQIIFIGLSLSIFEEAGWRGFALPRLEAKLGPVGGSLVLGLLIGIWHLPAFYVPLLGFAHNTLTFIVANTLAATLITLVWTWFFNHTGGSILIATLLHAVSDTSLGLPDKVFGQFTDDWGAVKLAVLALIPLLILTRGRLGYQRAQPPVQLPDVASYPQA